MSIQSGVQAALLSISAITDITSKIFVNSIPQNVKELPAVVIRKTGRDPYGTLGGGDEDDMKSAFIDLECIAMNEGDAIDLSETILDEFADFTGAADDVTILATILQDEDEDVDAADDASGRQFHTETVSFLFQYWRS